MTEQEAKEIIEQENLKRLIGSVNILIERMKL